MLFEHYIEFLENLNILTGSKTSQLSIKLSVCKCNELSHAYIGTTQLLFNE